MLTVFLFWFTLPVDVKELRFNNEYLRGVARCCSNYGGSGQQVISTTLLWEQLIKQHHSGKPVQQALQYVYLQSYLLKTEINTLNQMHVLIYFNTVQ